MGYSRLMGEYELGTLHRLTEYRAVISNLIGRHEGRIVDAGDALLAEFRSPVEGVACAVEIQRAVRERSEQLLERLLDGLRKIGLPD